MGKNKAAKRKKYAKMDQDEPEADAAPSAWTTGPAAGGAAAAMDTREPGLRETGSTKFEEALRVRQPGMKEKAGKRGNRTSKQKRRKASKLEKALNFTGRLESKNVRVDKDLALKKSGKNLWQNDAQP